MKRSEQCLGDLGDNNQRAKVGVIGFLEKRAKNSGLKMYSKECLRTPQVG